MKNLLFVGPAENLSALRVGKCDLEKSATTYNIVVAELGDDNSRGVPNVETALANAKTQGVVFDAVWLAAPYTTVLLTAG